MKIHELKTSIEYFEDVWDGSKKFEIRKDDRSFHVGDRLLLREFDIIGDPEYTGRTILVKVTYYLRLNGLLPCGGTDYAALGIMILRKNPAMKGGK